MTPAILHEYEDACMHLAVDLPEKVPGVTVTRGVAGVPVYPDYNQQDPRLAVYEIDVAMLVLASRSKSATLAVVPVALFETGDILASCAFSGTLAEQLRGAASEVLALRDGRWVCLGATPLRSGRFPTLDLVETVRGALVT